MFAEVIQKINKTDQIRGNTEVPATVCWSNESDFDPKKVCL